ncbi:MAG TPA: dTMP kinase [Terriglobales bacterium]|nr:dTMP kinase [Terriglobales bacterium]
MRSGRGIFITFEGLDGCGKTTQLARLAENLKARSLDVLATREPGGSAIGERIRGILLDSRTAGLSSSGELALMFADRAQHVEEVIQPALKMGKIVLCDRYTDSTEAYQGYGRRLGSELVLNLHRELCRDLWPDLTLLLDTDVNASVNRARNRNKTSDSAEGRFEAEDAAFFRRVQKGFESIARRERKRVVRIAPGTIQGVESEILKIIDKRFPHLGNRKTKLPAAVGSRA